MAKIRQVEVSNFRCIQFANWNPSPGINCLVGKGDSGKTTLIDAIDYCLTPRRTIAFSDADFHNFRHESPICISVTLGSLSEELLDFEQFGIFHRGFDPQTNSLVDEPSNEFEPVLTVRLTVDRELEPSWSLYSERADALELERDIGWRFRQSLAPTRVGPAADYHFGWSRNSVLARLAPEVSRDSTPLIEAERSARKSFGESIGGQADPSLELVSRSARELGISNIGNAKLMLDATSISLQGGAVALHSESETPLRRLGVGSKRLLIAALLREDKATAQIVLLDEVEHGLEPHRIVRLLESLGAKDPAPSLQVFATTHSPVVLRELSAQQLAMLREKPSSHELLVPEPGDEAQGTIRTAAEAFLSESVLVCEGASEIGLVRGLNQWYMQSGKRSISALSVSLVDGGGIGEMYKRAITFAGLEYRVATFRDSDRQPKTDEESEFTSLGGSVFQWSDRRSLEDELFASLTPEAIRKLVEDACVDLGEESVDGQIRHFSGKLESLGSFRAAVTSGQLNSEFRESLAMAAKRNSWYKSIHRMETVALGIIGPDLEFADFSLTSIIKSIFDWASLETG